MSVLLDYPCSSAYSCTPYTITVGSGRYKFECWRAKGTGNVRPGYGAYTSGILKTNKLTTFYVHIGKLMMHRSF